MSNLLRRRKAIYAKINFGASLVTVCMAVASLILTIVAEFVSIPTATHLALAIVFGSLGLIASIPLILSWAKLRKIEKELKANHTDEIGLDA